MERNRLSKRNRLKKNACTKRAKQTLLKDKGIERGLSSLSLTSVRMLSNTDLIHSGDHQTRHKESSIIVLGMVTIHPLLHLYLMSVPQWQVVHN